MPIVFCDIGWMERYDGIDGDSIQRDGSYNNDSIGHEVCNFSKTGDKVYGYVQPTGRINIERLGAKKGEEHARRSGDRLLQLPSNPSPHKSHAEHRRAENSNSWHRN